VRRNLLPRTGRRGNRAARYFAAIRVEVDGDEIVFSNATACPADGRYRWSIENDVLRFEPVGADECTGRTDSMADTEYTRSEIRETGYRLTQSSTAIGSRSTTGRVAWGVSLDPADVPAAGLPGLASCVQAASARVSIAVGVSRRLTVIASSLSRQIAGWYASVDHGGVSASAMTASSES
jgi:hypothetical protein